MFSTSLYHYFFVLLFFIWHIHPSSLLPNLQLILVILTLRLIPATEIETLNIIKHA